MSHTNIGESAREAAAVLRSIRIPSGRSTIFLITIAHIRKTSDIQIESVILNTCCPLSLEERVPAILKYETYTDGNIYTYKYIYCNKKNREYYIL